MASLEIVMVALYREEINCGCESFWDAGFKVWLGDDMNGRFAERDFHVDDAGLAHISTAGDWLWAIAREFYPHLPARLTSDHGRDPVTA